MTDDVCGECTEDTQTLKRDGDAKLKCSVCGFRAKHKGTVTRHLADRHNIGVIWHPCTVSGCGFRAKQKPHLTRHLADRHGVGVVWHACTGCDFRAKRKEHLTAHLADRHGVGVTWHVCTLCNFRTKHKEGVQRHLADRHDVGVTWHACTVPGCDFRAKRKEHLTGHVKTRHFQVYCQRKKIQEERVRAALLAAGWVEWHSGDTLPPSKHFKREHRIDFECAQASVDRSFCRIDFVLGCEGGGYAFLEVDEHQHRFAGDGIACDAKRMANVHASLTLEGVMDVPIAWVRYNPHDFRVDGVLQRLPKVEREARLCAPSSRASRRRSTGSPTPVTTTTWRRVWTSWRPTSFPTRCAVGCTTWVRWKETHPHEGCLV